MPNRFGGTPIDDNAPVSNRFGGIRIEDEEISVEPVEQEAPDRSLLEIGGDLGVSFASGANTLLKIGGDLYGLTTGDMENWASEQGERGADFWNARKSDTLKAMESNRTAKIDAADGTLSKAGTAFWETLSSPTLLTSFMFEQVPMLLPVAGVGRAAGVGAELLGAGAKVAGVAATGGAVATGAAMQGADAGTQAYDQLRNLQDEIWELNPDFQEMVVNGVPYDQAKDKLALDLSRDAAISSAIISGVVNLIPGARMLEKQLAGVKLPGVNKMKAVAQGFIGEGISEGIEEGSGALLANIATKQIDPSQDIMEGVGEAAGLGAVAAVFGGAAGLQSKSQSTREIIKDIETTSQAIQSAPTVDAAIETGTAIVGAQIAETIEGTENVEAQKIIDEQREAAEAVLAEKPEAQPEVPVSPVQETGGAFGGIAVEPTVSFEPTVDKTIDEKIETTVEKQAEPVTPIQPLTDEDRIDKEIGVQPVQEQVKEPVQEERVVADKEITLKTLKGFKNAKDAAVWVSDNAKEPVFRSIAKQIIQAIPESVAFETLGSGNRKRSITKGRFRTVSDKRTGEIVRQEVGIFREGRAEDTLTHELIHAAAFETVKNPKTPDQIKSVTDLKEVADGINMAMMTESKAMATLTREEQSAVLVVGSDYQEFVTHSLTNPIYQSALKKIPYKNTNISVFQKLSNTIKKLLGVEGVSDTAFSKAIEVSAAVVEATSQNVPAQKKQPISEVDNRLNAYRQSLAGSRQQPTAKGFSTFMQGMRDKYVAQKQNLPKDTIQGAKDFTQFIQAQGGQKVQLSEITLTRKITGKNGKIAIAQVKADVVLRQTRKKRDVALKLLRCIQ